MLPTASSTQDEVTDPPAGVVALSRILVFTQPLIETLRDVARLARASLQACDGAGVQLIARNGLGPTASTDSRSHDLDTLQDELGEGPCYECLYTGQSRVFGPATPHDRWHRFARDATQQGLIGCLALPLDAGDEFIGVLNLYAWPTTPFLGWDRDNCDAFANQASIGLANAQAYSRIQGIIAELQADLNAPDDVVHQACGVLMARERERPDQAQARLSRFARIQRRSIQEAAQSIIESLPQDP
jgi:GAF domain-containing protein